MKEVNDSVVIVGGGVAGDSCVTELRRQGFSGRVTIIGEEPWRPYERPPLSKVALREPELIAQSFFLKPEDWYHKNDVELMLGRSVTGIDLHSRKLTTDNGESMAFGRLLIATGGDVRRVRPDQWGDAINVNYLRTKHDALRLAPQLSPGIRLVVVGMGVIGSELAATARQLGCEVYAIEPEHAPMVRALGRDMAQWLGHIHEGQGVHVFYGRSLRRFVRDGDRVCAIECDDGTMIECDVVGVGIGIIPRVELAVSAALEVSDGIIVDSSNRTSCDFVFAAGDVARVQAQSGRTFRYETYQNAADQGAIAARAMLGYPSTDPLPCSFWTDQYNFGIQIVGTIADGLARVRRPLTNGGFAQLYLADRILAGCVAVNAGRDFMLLRRLVIAGKTIDLETLANPDIPLRDVLEKSA